MAIEQTTDNNTVDNLTVTEYLRLCLQFEENPTDENMFAIKSFLNKLIVREYLPLKEKVVALMEIMRSIPDEYDAPGAAWNLLLFKVEKGLFRYCTNLVYDMGIIGHTFKAYDCYEQYGLLDTIRNNCKKDYEAFCDILRDTMNFDNLYHITNTAALLNDTEYDKWIKTMNEIKDAINSETVQALISMNIQSSDAMVQFSNEMAKSALQKANEQISFEQNKAKAIDDYTKNIKLTDNIG